MPNQGESSERIPGIPRRGAAIEITPDLIIRESDIREDFVRAPGPGGQHVNKTATAVQLRFQATGVRSLPADVRRRLIRLAGRRMSKEGDLIIRAHRYRSRERNRQEARQRLVRLIRRAAEPPKPRRPTRPRRGAVEARLREKRRRGEKKQSRRPPAREE